MLSYLDSIFKASVSALAVLAGALATWIAARHGRKVIMQIRTGESEVKIEAQTPKQALQMLKVAEEYQKRHPTSI